MARRSDEHWPEANATLNHAPALIITVHFLEEE